MENTDKYPLAIRILHWLMAVMIIGLLAIGIYMADLERTDPLRAQLFALHKSFGITVLGLALLRVIVRLVKSMPPLPIVIKKQERILAGLGHFGLYFFMFALPFSGLVMTNSFGFAAYWFGVELPRIAGADLARARDAAQWHGYLAYALIGLIALHVAGALKHYVMEKLNLFKRMW